MKKCAKTRFRSQKRVQSVNDHDMSAACPVLKDFLPGVLAVLVLYRRELPQSETFRSLTAGLQALHLRMDLFVYDNSPAPSMTNREVSACWRIHYRHDPANPGVSRAYNEGQALAAEMGKEWLLLLDQDTVFPENALAVYCWGVSSHPDERIFAPVLRAAEKIYSPCRYFAGSGFHLSRIGAGKQSLQRLAVLNSGLLVGVREFSLVGGFNERVRLDFADFVFNRKLCRRYKHFYLLNLICQHHFSDRENLNIDEALQRFRFYCQGGRASIDSALGCLSLPLVVLVRGLRLTWRFRSHQFLITYLRHFLAGRNCAASRIGPQQNWP